MLDSARTRRDLRVRLPLEEPDEVEPPVADAVEAVAWLLPVDYMLGVLVLDATGCRIGELAAARVGDLDESRRACRAAGVADRSPHELRHRRISLLHRQGVSWAEIGARVGQRNLSVTADRYTHAMLDYGEVDRAKLLGRARRATAQRAGDEAMISA